jgi:uncharacterized tellurite resistance protein B-like protein
VSTARSAASYEGGEKAMFGSLRAIICEREKRPVTKGSENKARLATAALLVRVSTVDSDMSEARRRGLHCILKSRFGLDDVAAGQLLDDARVAERNAIDLYQFTRQINDAFDDEGRQRVVQMMWEMAYLEGGLNGFEANVIWRTADLLGVPSRQRVEMRQQIAAERSIPATR